MTIGFYRKETNQVGQHARISIANNRKPHLNGVGQHPRMVGQHKTEWWVNMVQNLQLKRENEKNGALWRMLEAAKKTGHITVVQAENTMDAANQIENIPAVIKNLIIANHGTTRTGDEAFFAIGTDNFHYDDVENNPYLSRIATRMMKPSWGDGEPNVIVFSCGAGGLYNKGDLLLKAVAKMFDANTYGPQAWCIASSSVFTTMGKK